MKELAGLVLGGRGREGGRGDFGREGGREGGGEGGGRDVGYHSESRHSNTVYMYVLYYTNQ